MRLVRCGVPCQNTGFYVCFPHLSAAGAGQEAVPEPGWRDEDVQRETEIASKGDVARLPSPEPHVREYR